MLKAQEEFGQRIRQHCAHGIGIWQDPLGYGPRWYAAQSSVHNLEMFYEKYGRWEAWVIELESIIRATLGRPETWTAQIARKFDLDKPLRFAMRLNINPGGVPRVFDLTNREVYSHRGPDFEDLRHMFSAATESPTWDQVRQGNINEVRRFEAMITAKLESHWIVGEPENTALEAACLALGKLPYIDIATVKAHVVGAEQQFRRREWKPGAAVMRCAIEQILEDAHAQLIKATGIAAASDLAAKTEQLWKNGAVGKETARYAYATYGLLSDVGSHAGQVPADDGERAWHAGRVAIAQLAARLT